MRQSLLPRNALVRNAHGSIHLYKLSIPLSDVAFTIVLFLTQFQHTAKYPAKNTVQLSMASQPGSELPSSTKSTDTAECSTGTMVAGTSNDEAQSMNALRHNTGKAANAPLLPAAAGTPAKGAQSAFHTARPSHACISTSTSSTTLGRNIELGNGSDLVFGAAPDTNVAFGRIKVAGNSSALVGSMSKEDLLKQITKRYHPVQGSTKPTEGANSAVEVPDPDETSAPSAGVDPAQSNPQTRAFSESTSNLCGETRQACSTLLFVKEAQAAVKSGEITFQTAETTPAPRHNFFSVGDVTAGPGSDLVIVAAYPTNVAAYEAEEKHKSKAGYSAYSQR